MDIDTVNRLLDVIEKDIVPKTLEGVKSGNKLFGAAILRKSDLSLIVASTNDETKNPLFHGEVSAINDFYALKSRIPTSECIFLATHEPCSLCLSAITWAGFDNFTYLFTYEDSRKAFKIPYDIEILEEVYRTADPGCEISSTRPLYNRKNKFFTSSSLKADIEQLQNAELDERVRKITQTYEELSSIYQRQKGSLVLP